MWQAALCGEDMTANGEYALLSVDSTLQFDNLIGGTSLSTLAPLLRAQLLSMEERYSEALELYEKFLPLGIEEGMARLQGGLLADLAWCRLKLGQVEEARVDAALAEDHIDSAGQHDDRALTYSRLEKVYFTLNEGNKGRQNAELAKKEWSAHRDFQSNIISVLSSNTYITDYRL